MISRHSRWVACCLLGWVVGLAVACRSERPDPPIVSVAASMFPAVRAAAGEFGAGRPDRGLAFNVGASTVLLEQVLRGGRVGLFLSASPAEIDRLIDSGLADPETRRTLARNELTIVRPLGFSRPAALDQLRQVRPVAVANPRTAPLGRYTREALEATALWSAMQPNLVFAENARQVAEYVARGDALAGVVYRTDAALMAERLVTGPSLPSGSYGPILYQGVALRNAGLPEREFLEWLASPGGTRALERHGFLPPS